MTEAEVSLLLAEYLVREGAAVGTVEIALDGAQVEIKGRVVFPVREFLEARGWARESEGESWQGTWVKQVGEKQLRLRLHATAGQGDVVTVLQNGRRLRAEAKGGPLRRSKSSVEYPKLREALGQCLTLARVEADEDLAAAVPNGERFSELANRWRDAPLVKKLGLRILLVSPSGDVEGLDPRRI